MRRRGALSRFRGLRGEDGFVLVFAAVCIPALLGLVGLAIDGARLMTFDTQLAAAADASALAAAGQLDWTEGAMERAREAAGSLTNRTSFSQRDRTMPRLSFRFAASLADLTANPGFTLPDEDSAQAVFVEVTTAEYTLTASFLQSVGRPVRRRAIAEARYVACDVTPMVLCHADPERFDRTARPGRQYLLRMDGNVADGSVALLDRPDDRNSRTTLRNIASTGPAFCYGDGVALRRNLAAPDFDDAMNIRFDRYFNGIAEIASDLAAFPPAPSIIQGRHLDVCTSPPTGGSVNPPYHLPRDQAYRTVLPGAAYDQGLGDWPITPAYGGLGESSVARALDEYILWNHSDKDRSFQDRLKAAPTRYDIYLRELGLTRETETQPVNTAGNALAGKTMPTGGPLTGPFAFVRENPAPICYGGTRPASDARRRILYMAVADCRAFPEAARAESLSRHIGKFFLTEPANGGAMLVELVEMLTPKRDDGKLRPAVRLVETH